MSKRDKEIKRLRREVEILRAQLKSQEGKKEIKRVETPRAASPAQPKTIQPSVPSLSYVRADLRRSLIITAFITAVIGALTLSQPHWPKVF